MIQVNGARRFERDTISVQGDAHPGEPLLVPAMLAGRRLAQPTLAASRSRCLAGLERLPAPEVVVAPALRRLAEEVDRGTP